MMDDENFKGACRKCGMFIYADGSGHAENCPVNPLLRVEEELRLKVSPPIDVKNMVGAYIRVSGYTVDGNGNLCALSVKMESGVEVDITPVVI